jgi:hypothetical protein
MNAYFISHLAFTDYYYYIGILFQLKLQVLFHEIFVIVIYQIYNSGDTQFFYCGDEANKKKPLMIQELLLGCPYGNLFRREICPFIVAFS